VDSAWKGITDVFPHIELLCANNNSSGRRIFFGGVEKRGARLPTMVTLATEGGGAPLTACVSGANNLKCSPSVMRSTRPEACASGRSTAFIAVEEYLVRHLIPKVSVWICGPVSASITSNDFLQASASLPLLRLLGRAGINSWTVAQWIGHGHAV